MQAPTGSGKTRAALYPFLSAWEYDDDFPRKCLYSVPFRVLANQFLDEYRRGRRHFGLTRPMDVTIQTGARPEDPCLEGNLIFTTIDQTLSNFLNIPYSLSPGQGNLNAGAVLFSYLVFDELHLFDPEISLPTTVRLLQLLRGIVPFIAMSAILVATQVVEVGLDITCQELHTELAVVNAAHGESDKKLLENLNANRFTIADRIAKTIETQEKGAARELIRAVDSRTVMVHPDPERIENPWAYEGFVLFRGSLLGAFDGLQILAEELGQDRTLMTAIPLSEEESSRERTVWQWRPIRNKDDLLGALILAVNPRLSTYSPETGFRLGVPGDGMWASPLRVRDRNRPAFAPYRRETFQEHVTRMLQVYEQPFRDREKDGERPALAEESAYAARRLEQKYGWPAGTLDRLARWAIGLHDLGKLDVRWQKWAHRWQEEVSTLRGEDLHVPEDYLAAHTDYDEESAAERELNSRLRRMKPNHSAEGAAAAMDWLLDRTGDQALARAALTALVRHHSASASGRHGPFRSHPAAKTALREALGKVDMEGVRWEVQEGELFRRLIRPRRDAELLPYLLLARVVRMADQRSQAL